jgi:hypothetical protein
MFTFQSRSTFNPLMAACLGFASGPLEDCAQCFALAVSSEVDALSLTPADVLSRDYVDVIRRALLGDDAAIERVCFRYVSELHVREIASPESVDPDLLGEFLYNFMIDEGGPPIDHSSKFYALDWIQIKEYVELKRWLLCPIYFVLDDDFITLSEFIAAHTEYDAQASQDEVCLSRAEVGDTKWRDALLHFFSLNDPSRLSAVNGKARRIELACPLLELKARSTRLGQRFKIHGLLPGSEVERLEFQFRKEEIAEVFTGPSGERYDEDVGLELLAKAFIVRRTRDSATQGIPTAVYRPLLRLLIERQEVTSVRDLRRLWGVPEIKIDPFALLPGRIVAYAPGHRFLKDDRVSFVLRDWVETPENRRGRIAKIRILTPLRSLTSTTSSEWVLRVLAADPVWEMFGVASLLHRRFIEVEFSSSEARWVFERTRRIVKQILSSAGHRCFDNLVFERTTWAKHDFPTYPTHQWRWALLEAARQIAISKMVPADQLEGHISLLASLVGYRAAVPASGQDRYRAIA